MNIINISTKFLKSAQQLNFDREEEEAPEHFVWTDEETSLDRIMNNYDYSNLEIGRNLELFSKRMPESNIPYEFSFDVQSLKVPNLTKEYLEQIGKNDIIKKELELEKLKEFKENNKHYQYSENIYHLEHLIGSLNKKLYEQIDKILEVSNELRNEYEKLKYNYLKAKTYLATFKQEDKNYLSLVEFIKDLPNLLKNKLFRILPLKYLSTHIGVFSNQFKITNKNLNEIFTNLQERLTVTQSINLNFKEAESNIIKYILKVENFIEEYLSDKKNIEHLNYLDAQRPEIIKSIYNKIKEISSAFTNPQGLIAQLHWELQSNSFEMFDDVYRTVNDEFIYNKDFDKIIEYFIQDNIKEFLQKLQSNNIAYLIDENLIEIELNQNVFEFLLKEFNINLNSIIEVSPSKYKKINFNLYPSVLTIKDKIVKEKIDIKNKDVLKEFVKNLFYDNIKFRISQSISNNFLFSGTSEIIYYGGGVDKISVLKCIKILFPEINKGELLLIEKKFFNNSNDNYINKLFQLDNILAYKEIINIFYHMLFKENKLNHKDVIDLMTNFKKYINSIDVINSYAPPPIKDEINDIIKNNIRSYETIETDINNLTEIMKMFHNEANNLPRTLYLRIFKNSNIINFTKSADIKKIISFYIKFKSSGGIKFLQQNKNDINHLIKIGAIQKTFFDNIIQVVDFFENSGKLSLKLSPQIITALNTAETDLQFLSDAETYKKYFKLVEPKDENIYKLNYQLSSKLRFRALREKDPRHLRIGIETNCCQRVGGAAESCVVDSFINSLAGILILEMLNDSGQWNLISQSYFHYVPEDNGYILDNVEATHLKSKLKENFKISLELCYNLLAKHILDLGYKYVLAGKEYSKIEPEAFETSVMEDDKRTYHEQSGYDVYSDYNYQNAIDLSKIKES